MKHIIITPFYVRRHFKGFVDPQLASLQWLETRFRLFADYCLPSVVTQTDQNFEWFIYFDDLTPPESLRRAKDLTAGYPNISIRTCASWNTPTLTKDVNAAVASGNSWVMTTRLDNDDGLHRRFIEMLHAKSRESEEYLNFATGLILYDGKCFIYRHSSNAFLTLVEPVDRLRTVWSIAHERAAELAPVRQITGLYGFLQVVHGSNVSNKPRGKRTFALDALQGFEGIPTLGHAIEKESGLAIAWTNATTVAAWKARDVLIALAKRVRR